MSKKLPNLPLPLIIIGVLLVLALVAGLLWLLVWIVVKLILYITIMACVYWLFEYLKFIKRAEIKTIQTAKVEQKREREGFKKIDFPSFLKF